MESVNTTDLIAEYNTRMAGQFANCNLGSSRWTGRQARIDAIVDELSDRADAGDPDALAWYAQ